MTLKITKEELQRAESREDVVNLVSRHCPRHITDKSLIEDISKIRSLTDIMISIVSVIDISEIIKNKELLISDNWAASIRTVKSTSNKDIKECENIEIIDNTYIKIKNDPDSDGFVGHMRPHENKFILLYGFGNNLSKGNAYRNRINIFDFHFDDEGLLDDIDHIKLPYDVLNDANITLLYDDTGYLTFKLN